MVPTFRTNFNPLNWRKLRMGEQQTSVVVYTPTQEEVVSIFNKTIKGECDQAKKEFMVCYETCTVLGCRRQRFPNG
ncbi:MAG: hypothetical protein OHK0017_05430 [Patescibacteria group bacterium]